MNERWLLSDSACESAEKPNVLFLFADDFTYEAISSFGHTDIETPNLDRLVNRGTMFTHAYNMGSNASFVTNSANTIRRRDVMICFIVT